MRPLLAFAALLSACAGKPPCGPTGGTVSKVVDGDTIELQSGEKVRYLLVDAPEITQGHDDCYGRAAADYNAATVGGRQVTLKYDDESCTDRFGRLLAYVSVGGAEVNRALVDQGLACVLYISPGGMARRQEFEDAEAVAKSNRAGLWGVCSPVTCE